MNKRRKIVIALGATAFAASFSSLAQHSVTATYRIGFLGAESSTGFEARINALKAGLRDLGYLEGKNIAFEFLWAEGNYDRLPQLAADLARSKPHVLIPIGVKAAMALKNATLTIPIVVPATAGDPVATGLVTSLARPGGNITGSTSLGQDISAKQLELIKELFPRITQMAVLFNPENASSRQNILNLKTAANSVKVRLNLFEVKSPKEFDRVFPAIAKAHIPAAILLTDTLFVANAKRVADISAQQRITVAADPSYAEFGCLIGYGTNRVEMYREAGALVDKLLKGAKPDDVPFQQATKFELVVNMKTAKALGITIPNSILVRADKVIE